MEFSILIDFFLSPSLTQTDKSSLVNPIVAGGTMSPALFSDGNFSRKMGSGGPKFLDFS